MAKKRTDAERVKELMEKAEKAKAVIAAERDTLRQLHSELEDILESVDEGIDEISDGLRYLESGIDRMSQYL